MTHRFVLAAGLALGLQSQGPLFAASGGPGPGVYFVPTSNNFPALVSGCLAVADYDNDGLLDVVMAGSSQDFPQRPPLAEIWRNTGSGFVKIPTPLPPVYSCSLAWGDVDNDGRLDLAISGLDKDALVFYCEVWRNTPDGFVKYAHLSSLFGTGDTQVVLDLIGKLEFADVNRDGRLDLVVLPRFSGYPFPVIWKNTGSGFESVATDLPHIFVGSSATDDFDGDGLLDIVVSGVKQDRPDLSLTEVWRQTSRGFQPMAVLPGLWDGPIAVTDFNADGLPDLLVGGSSVTPFNLNLASRLLLNTNGGFQDSGIFFPGSARGSFAWADFDNDGRPDLLNTGLYENDRLDFSTSVLLNQGSSVTPVWSANVGYGEHASAWIDVDRDGRLDVIHTGQDFDLTNTVNTAIWRNVTAKANTAPSAPSGLTATAENGLLRLSWEAATDVETPTSSLTYNVRVGTSPGAGDVLNPMAGTDGTRRLLAAGNAKHRRFLLLEVPLDRPYYWSVQAVDGALAGGTFATEQTIPAGSLQAVRITKTERLASGQFAMEFVGEIGVSYVVEATASLSQNPPAFWSSLGTAQTESPGRYRFIDTNPPTTSASRFYRVVAQR